MTIEDTQQTIKELNEFIVGIENYLKFNEKSADPELRIIRAQMVQLARLVKKLTVMEVPKEEAEEYEDDTE